MTKSTGARNKSRELTLKMRADMIKNGYSYGQLEFKYKVDRSNIRKRVLRLDRKALMVKSVDTRVR
jgi:hypothetical protein